MARPRTPVGKHTPITYAYRNRPRGTWTVKDLPAARSEGITRAKQGRAWRAQTRVGLPHGTKELARVGATPAEAESALRHAIDTIAVEAAAEARTGSPTLRTYMRWVQDQIIHDNDPTIRSSKSRARYLAVLSTWGGMDRHDGKRRIHKHASTVLDIPVALLTPAMLDDEMAAIRAGGGLSALGQLRALWRKALSRAVRDGEIAVSPAIDLRIAGVREARGTRVYANGAPRPRDNALTDDQLRDILATVAADPIAVRRGVVTVLEIAAATGLRIGEAISLRWEDLDLDAPVPTLSVRGQLIRIPGEGLGYEARLKSALSARTLPLTPRLAEHLLARKVDRAASEARRASPYVLATERRMMPDPDNVSSDIRAALDRAGYTWVTLHTVRRTVENRLLAAAVPPHVIERVMGHTTTTGHRAYWDRAVDARGALEALET